MNIKLLSLALILGFVFVACGDDDPEPEACDSPDITYTNGAKAILDGSCAVAGCHTDAALAGMFSLEGYAQASSLESKASNIFEKKAAKIGADKIRKETDKKVSSVKNKIGEESSQIEKVANTNAQRIEDEAESKAKKIEEEAHQKADKI